MKIVTKLRKKSLRARGSNEEVKNEDRIVDNKYKS